MRNKSRAWAPLPSDEWQDTIDTLHLWTQVIGKIRLVQSTWLNHSWNVPLYVTPTGLTTGLVPHGTDSFEWSFDFERNDLTLTTSLGAHQRVPLTDGLSVADFYERVMSALDASSIPVQINVMPSEIPGAIPFPEDTTHNTYVPEQARALHRALLDATRVFERFRSGFRGKASRVHFFWGSFDLAVTRFSGRDAPTHPGGLPNFPDDVAAEAYSHELTSVGFWPGNRDAPTPIFYAYAYPTPDGFSSATVEPEAAFWLEELGEFALPYDAVAAAADPDSALLRFCESTHAAAADLAGWDRLSLECEQPHGPDWFTARPHKESPNVAEHDVDADVITIRDVPEEHRYVISVDGRERGSAVYQQRGQRWFFVHTETDPSFGGRGLGSKLARAALDDVEARGGVVVPLCPFIAAWIERHPEYDRLVDHDILARLTDQQR